MRRSIYNETSSIASPSGHSPANSTPHSTLLRSILIAVVAALAVLPCPASAEKITYDDHVLPIFREKCLACHNPDKKEGDLDLGNYTNLMQGGGSGSVIAPGDSSGSYLYKLVTHEEEPAMPLESPKIPDEMIATVGKWIDGGALENQGSTAPKMAKPKFDFGGVDGTSGRPEVLPLPGRLSLEPVTRTSTTTALPALATSPWAPVAAVAGQKQVLLFNTETFEVLGALPFPEGVAQVLRFSRNGSLLLAGGGRAGASGLVVLWDIKSGDRVVELGDELETVLAADISGDQTLIALGGPQRVVRVYSTETGEKKYELRKHTDWIYSIEFSPDDVLLATGDRNGGLFVWEAWTGREYLTLKAHSQGVTGVSWRSDSNLVASCSEDGSVRLWEMENGNQVKNWGGHGGGVASIEFCRDGRLLTCGRDRAAKLWKQDGTEIRGFEAFGDLALRVSFCDETNRVIAGDWQGEIRVFNAEDGARLGELTSNPPTLAERLAAANTDLTEKMAAHLPLETSAQSAAAAASQAQTDLVAAQQVATESKQRNDEALAAQATAKTMAEGISQLLAAATKVVTELEPALPALQESAAKAQESSSQVPGDQQLADLAAQLRKIAGERALTLDENRKTVAVKTPELEQAQQQLAAADTTVADTTTARQSADQRVAEVTPLAPPAVEAASAARQAADTAAAAVAAAQANVDRWTSEIAFAQQLNELLAARAAAKEILQTRMVTHAELAATATAAQDASAQAATQLGAAQTSAVELNEQLASATTAVGAAKEAVTQANAARDQAALGATTLEAALVTLDEAVQKTQEAADKSGDDEQLADAAAQLAALLGGKRAELEERRADVVTKTTAIEAAVGQVAATNQAVIADTAALEAGQNLVTEMAAARESAAAELNQAQQAAEAAAQVVIEAQLQVAHAEDELAIARGLKERDALVQNSP